MLASDVTEHDLRVMGVISGYLGLIRPLPGEYEIIDNFCRYSPGVRYLIKRVYEEIEKDGLPFRLHIISGGLAFVENRTPPTLFQRFKRYLNDTRRSTSS